MSSLGQLATSSTRRRRLGYYVMGLAIGLVLLGFFQLARRGEQQARGRAGAAAPAPQAP